MDVLVRLGACVIEGGEADRTAEQRNGADIDGGRPASTVAASSLGLEVGSDGTVAAFRLLG